MKSRKGYTNETDRYGSKKAQLDPLLQFDQTHPSHKVLSLWLVFIVHDFSLSGCVVFKHGILNFVDKRVQVKTYFLKLIFKE